ncbi:ADP-heptose synthase [Paenibacillus sp. 1001270B_150601_E10]|uniref:ADP-heptose synthase n=1 Tax=Paenibacillus sp. 1001270B_150601_E10 TaxID=2787079 RepID=UPI002B4BEEC9|nr:ADP-heptose synthase [Paenibacillus sp. 1001270B_150601_E10]
MQPRRFVIEAIMLAIYGHLLDPKQPVQYIIPYTSIMELYEIRESGERVMPEPEEDQLAQRYIHELLDYFESDLNDKKIKRALSQPWKSSQPLLLESNASCIVINAMDNMQYGELFDPIETELILTSIREQAPLLTDQFEFISRLIEHEVPVPVYDVDDFEYAVEHDLETDHYRLGKP